MPHNPAAARVSALTRHRPPDDPSVVAARQALVEHQIAETIREKARTAPPLTEAAKTRLVMLILTADTAVNT